MRFQLAGRQFEHDSTATRSIPVVSGCTPHAVVINPPLSRQFDDYGRTSVAGAGPEAPPAVTEFRRLAMVELPEAVDRYPGARYALLELRPRSGRQHQLRRHLKHVAHPIIGDANWGKGVHNRFFQRRFGCHRLLLTCTELVLRHPANRERLTIAAAPEASFSAVTDALGWTAAGSRALHSAIVGAPQGLPSIAGGTAIVRGTDDPSA